MPSPSSNASFGSEGPQTAALSPYAAAPRRAAKVTTQQLSRASEAYYSDEFNESNSPTPMTPDTEPPPPIVVTYPELVSNFINTFAGMGLRDKDTFCKLLGCLRWAIPGVEGALAEPVVRDWECPDVCVLTAEQRQEIAAADRDAGRVFLPLIADGQFAPVSLYAYGSGLYRKAVHRALQQVDQARDTRYAADFDASYKCCQAAYQRKEDEEALSASSRDE